MTNMRLHCPQSIYDLSGNTKLTRLKVPITIVGLIGRDHATEVIRIKWTLPSI